jgi:hypothetical protein
VGTATITPTAKEVSQADTRLGVNFEPDDFSRLLRTAVAAYSTGEAGGVFFRVVRFPMVGVDVGVGLHVEGRQPPVVLLGVERSLLGVHLTALAKVEFGGEEIDRGNSHAETSFLRWSFIWRVVAWAGLWPRLRGLRSPLA